MRWRHGPGTARPWLLALRTSGFLWKAEMCGFPLRQADTTRCLMHNAPSPGIIWKCPARGKLLVVPSRSRLICPWGSGNSQVTCWWLFVPRVHPALLLSCTMRGAPQPRHPEHELGGGCRRAALQGAPPPSIWVVGKQVLVLSNPMMCH